MAVKAPSLADVDDWFDRKIIPKRTTNAGFSLNRIINGPRAVLSGNNSDPNGLCGDAAAYVVDRYIDDIATPATSDGFVMAVILWNGTILNHIANIMLKSGKTGRETYDAVGGHLNLKKPATGTPQYSMSDLSDLYVYDLYYKTRSNALEWWKARDASMSGTITVALMSDMAD